MDLDAVGGQREVTHGHDFAVVQRWHRSPVGPRRESRPASGSARPRAPRGDPKKTPRPSWRTVQDFPCTSSCAGATVPPNASTIAWCPRQTPSVGVLGARRRRLISSVAPASAGRPGPGEMTRCEGASRAAVLAVDRVVAAHADIGAELSEEMREVVRERVVVVDQQDQRCSRSARSMAASTAASLRRHSSCSAVGLESATIPAPACRCATPSSRTIVLIAMHVSSVASSGSA